MIIPPGLTPIALSACRRRLAITRLNALPVGIDRQFILMHKEPGHSNQALGALILLACIGPHQKRRLTNTPDGLHTPRRLNRKIRDRCSSGYVSLRIAARR